MVHSFIWTVVLNLYTFTKEFLQEDHKTLQTQVVLIEPIVHYVNILSGTI